MKRAAARNDCRMNFWDRPSARDAEDGEGGKIKEAERARRFNYDRSARSALDKYRACEIRGVHFICFLDPKAIKPRDRSL